MKNIFIFTFFLLPLLLLGGGRGWSQIITTVAGDGTQGYSGDNILAKDAELYCPFDVALDGKGNYYITDGYNNRIRKVNSAGIITTIAGTGVQGYNGDNIPATAAQIYRPVGITFDHLGNLYFTDAFNSRVRKIDTSGIITTVAGNGDFGYNGDNIPADSAKLYEPWAIAIDPIGNLYISDQQNHRIRKVTPANGIITTIAGTGIAGNTGDNGPADSAGINMPYGIALDDTGNIYFADYGAYVVRKIDTFGIITTFAGTGLSSFSGDNGSADSAGLKGPAGLTIDSIGNVYISDVFDHHIRKVTVSTGIITSVAGSVGGFSGDGGPAIAAELYSPTGIAVDAVGNLYIADWGNERIRYVGWPEGVHQLSAATQTLIVYPNPSDGFFTINITSNIQAQVQVIITNELGQNIKETTAFTNTPLTIQLDQPDGVYFISAVSTDGIMNKIINIIK